MRHCYLCDDEINGSGFRRNVGTGRSNRISVGRRISTSSTQRSGLRTLCAACAGRVDDAARLRNKVVGVGAVVVVGFVVLGSLKDHGPTVRPDVAATRFPALVQAPTPSLEPRSTTYARPAAPTAPVQPASMSAFQPALAAPSPAVPSAEAAIIAPVVPDAAQKAIVPALASYRNGATVPWRHRTAAGTRWSLRQAPGGVMALLIDLSGNQVAAVLVAPEIQNLDLPGMDGRIEYMRSQALRSSASSAAYAFTRGGVLVPYP